MQHQYWITKQTLSRKLGRKEDQCIVSSDAELDTKLELIRNIQMSCNLIQRIIDKYQESNCTLSQEQSSMGRFLKENSEHDKTRAGEIMLALGKSMIYCAQQQLNLHEPLLRFYQEVDTFRHRAIADTLQNVIIMEKARTEYRAALSWMKNISQQLDPDTTKQLEKFKKVQSKVRKGKINFDKLAVDCSQKIDLLAAARCNMLNHALTFYQSKLLDYAKKSAEYYSKVENSFKGHAELCYRSSVSVPESSEDNTNSKEEEIDQSDSQIESSQNLIDNLAAKQSSELVCNDKTTEIVNNIIDIENEESNASLFSCLNWESINSTSKDDSHNLPSELESIFKTVSNDQAKQCDPFFESSLEDILKMEPVTQEQNMFLPSNILKQSFENTSSFKTGIDTKLLNLTKDLEASNKKQKHNSWLSLFKDLDPLENNSIEDNSMKNKNSLV